MAKKGKAAAAAQGNPPDPAAGPTPDAQPEPEIARGGPKMVVLKAPENVCSISGDGPDAEPIMIPESGLVEVTEDRAAQLQVHGFTVHRG